MTLIGLLGQRRRAGTCHDQIHYMQSHKVSVLRNLHDRSSDRSC